MSDGGTVITLPSPPDPILANRDQIAAALHRIADHHKLNQGFLWQINWSDRMPLVRVPTGWQEAK